ncbi:MAG: hypothetical protein U5L96_00115 [Owenweeksia sp.]|nr:hypothetical protein [Owenweeksia sp.]
MQSGGYTQSLREFDRVYIELENSDFGKLRAGDYNITNTENYFLRFDKRVSGAGLFTNLNLGEGNLPLQVQAGLARGRFARNRFQAQEGNLGPYKLTGANGERFIIIISGSERVYQNGVLLERGQQNDYVMDYNAGGNYLHRPAPHHQGEPHSGRVSIHRTEFFALHILWQHRF